MTHIEIGYLRVLVVDDSALSRTSMRNMLSHAGVKHLDEADSAAAAREKMSALRYNIVFLDWVMPDQSGLSLLQEWREDRNYDDVVVCVVSMNNDKTEIAGALKAGAHSYIIKPPTEQMLQKNLEKAIEWLSMRKAYIEKKNG